MNPTLFLLLVLTASWTGSVLVHNAEVEEENPDNHGDGSGDDRRWISTPSSDSEPTTETETETKTETETEPKTLGLKMCIKPEETKEDPNLDHEDHEKVSMKPYLSTDPDTVDYF